MKIANAAAAALVGVLACFSASASAETEASAKKHIEGRLKDPESVRYKNVRTFADGTICGEYNSKGSGGGYTGFTMFTFAPDRLPEIEATYADWEAVCNDSPQKEGKLAAIKLQAKFNLYYGICRYRPEYPGLKQQEICGELKEEGYRFLAKYPGVPAPTPNF